MFPSIPAARIIPSLNGISKKDVLRELASAVHQEFSQLEEMEIFQALNEREEIGSTGIGEGLAIPHAKLKELREVIIYFGRSGRGVVFDAHDGKPVHLFFLLLAPAEASKSYLSNLARLSRILKTPSIRAKIINAADAHEISRILSETA